MQNDIQPDHLISHLWRTDEGEALGRFFQCTLRSHFEPIREAFTRRVLGHDALVRSVDGELSPFKLLDGAANDEESIQLDRLCRTIHAINYFRQHQEGDLYLRVHDRLLSAVGSNHGFSFLRILKALELPPSRVVLTLPPVQPSQGWLLGYVADNYRRNGFRMAFQAHSAEQALDWLKPWRPAAIKLDVASLGSAMAVRELVLACAAQDVTLIFKHVETLSHLDLIARVAEGSTVYVQGRFIDAGVRHPGV